MKVLIVYCHPCRESFTAQVKKAFIKGLTDAGKSYEISDLYEMKFDPVFTESEYKREAFYEKGLPVPSDVAEEQKKINNSDAIVFIYPVFWTECPALLTGWFQRVWTYGFAYGDDPAMKQLEKALFLVTMGGSVKDNVRVEQISAMKTVMIGDRIHNRAKSAEMIVFDEMTRGYGNDENRNERIKQFAKQAYQIGINLGEKANDK
ncbi:MAG: NAD(P)H-dependent oxidoreductase [Oscillospiraceae bacterium]|nr:NAD(P)H-dependent oxidoreductase [Oscillospiraceae bacterium]